MPMPQRRIAIPLLLVLSSCAVGNGELYKFTSPDAASSAFATPATGGWASPPECDVRMYAEQLPGGEDGGLDPKTMGATIVEKVEGAVPYLQNGVCIKRKGHALELPASMLIASVNEQPRLGRFCMEKEKTSGLKIHSGTQMLDANYCTWNGVFHSSRPFTFKFTTDQGHTVGEYIDYVRVYRNSDLMAAWNRSSGQHDSALVKIQGGSLVSGIFSATHPPHLAPIDIRVIPRDQSINESVDTQVRNDHERFLQELSTGFAAASNVVLPPGSPERQSFDCLSAELKADAQKFRQIITGEAVLAPPCSVLAATPASTPLSSEYSKVENQGREALDALQQKAYSSVDQLRNDFKTQLPSRVQAVLKDFLNSAVAAGKKNNPALTSAASICANELLNHTLNGDCRSAILAVDPALATKYTNVVAIVDTINTDVVTVLASGDEAYALAGAMASKAKEIVASPKEQAQVFNAFAQSIAAEGSPFEPRKDNPPLLAGEQKIDLSYSDHLQGFFFAPWNGVPIRAFNNADADFSAAVMVPFLDVVGGRYQWGKNRFADARLAAGLGYTETERTDGNKQTGALVNASLGFGTMKVGIGVVTGKGLGDTKDRTRIIIGADLYKLISGSNVEAF